MAARAPTMAGAFGAGQPPAPTCTPPAPTCTHLQLPQHHWSEAKGNGRSEATTVSLSEAKGNGRSEATTVSLSEAKVPRNSRVPWTFGLAWRTQRALVLLTCWLLISKSSRKTVHKIHLQLLEVFLVKPELNNKRVCDFLVDLNIACANPGAQVFLVANAGIVIHKKSSIRSNYEYLVEVGCPRFFLIIHRYPTCQFMIFRWLSIHVDLESRLGTWSWG